MPQRNVAIVIFDEVEVLDFAGPYEVFSTTGSQDEVKPFNVYTVTVADEIKPVLARNALSVNPDYTLANCPPPDILLIPGGFGTRREMNNSVLLDWIGQQAPSVELLLSVCTGALILGRAGLLDGLNSTTHHSEFDLLREAAPKTTVRPGERYIDNGQVITSAGVSAGIDMSLYVVKRLLGEEEAVKTAQDMEYNWNPQEEHQPI